MSAAQLETSDHDDALAHAAPTLLKQQVAERLAAHRQRKTRVAREQTSHQGISMEAVAAPASLDARANRIAAAVAERFAQTQSYHAFLAEESEKAVRQAEAAAEVAHRNARAIVEAQRAMLEEMALEATRKAAARMEQEARAAAETRRAMERMEEMERVEQEMPAFADVEEPAPVAHYAAAAASAPGKRKAVAQTSTAGFSVRLYEDVGRVAEDTGRRSGNLDFGSELYPSEDERRVLEEEIAFRQSPTFELERPTTPIPGNLLEFPRQLVATRKARPRYAEGPLREDMGMAHDGAQLRIFEVEAEQISAEPVLEPAAPEWSSIWLDALVQEAPEESIEEQQYVLAQRPLTAPVSHRVMAGLVDGCLVGLGVVGFGGMFAYSTSATPSLPVAGVASGGAFIVLFLAYQMLFFTFADATPGMRYARIGLCTFGDENPTRGAMRLRVLAKVLALVPLGLGFLWACLDEDRLGWHDRISRMYQRSY